VKIVKIEALPFRIPMKKATVWARGAQDAAEHVLVKVYTDEGITGIVEAPPRPTIYGESIQSIKFAVEKWFGPMMMGMNPFELEKIWDKFDTIAWNPVAKGALDMAVYDIIGKALNMPCYKLLGCWTDSIPMSWCVNLNPLDDMIREAQEMIEGHGFKALKLKVGIEPRKDIELVRTMRREFGEGILIYVDANQGYDPFTAIKVLNEMTEYNIVMVEEPCPMADKKGRKMISQKISIPVMGDESCPTPADVAREVELDTLRVISIKTARTGFTLSRKIVHLCEQAGIRNIHGMQGDTATGSFASAQFCAAFKNTSGYYPSDGSFFLQMADDFVKEPPVIKGGLLTLPPAPGLGFEIDEKKFKQFAIA
jgi:L-alanine-DL-glutamate epimerase-like enolase superfamily enzyme